MSWKIYYSPEAIRNLDKLDPPVARKVTAYMRERISTIDDPRSIGKALKGLTWGDCWRYRCGDYRIIVTIADSEILINVLRVGNRKDVY